MYDLERMDVLKVIKEEFANFPIVIPLAATAREMHSLGPKANEFYVLGSMGMPISIASGILLGFEKRSISLPVLCLEGDGSLLMNLNSLATIKYLDLKGLILIVLDNEGYSVTGNQVAQSKTINLSRIAESVDFKVLNVLNKVDLDNAIKAVKEDFEQKYFVHVKINNIIKDTPLIFTDPVILKNTFVNYLNQRMEVEV
jgi:sulfopyruvate decarboxylase subunit beta